jgi:hypothetical protein
MRYAQELLGCLLEDSLSMDREQLLARWSSFSVREIDELMKLSVYQRKRLYNAWLDRPTSAQSRNYATPTPRTPVSDGSASPWGELATRVLEEGLNHE